MLSVVTTSLHQKSNIIDSEKWAGLLVKDKLL